MNARDVVMQRIAQQSRRWPELDLSSMEVGGLDPRDAALAGAIEHAVMRRWLTLSAIVESRLTQSWPELEAKVQAALLAGAAQLLLLDRVPDHAAINESVEWAKRNIRPKAGGLVNAVLRKVAAVRGEISKPSAQPGADGLIGGRDELPLADGRVWKLQEPVFDGEPIRRLAQHTSHPETLIAHWMATLGERRTIELAHHNLVHAPIIVHAGALPPGVAPESLAAASDQLEPHDEPGFSVFTGERDSLASLLRDRPELIVQDPASALPARSTASLLPLQATIIDACAGRGTKTRQLAAIHPHARIIATDKDQERLGTLREQFRGHGRVQVVEHAQLAEFNGQADLLVLDVPCTNTGVLARRVEAKYRFTAASLSKIVSLQRQLIADSILLLGPRGRVLYATCSIEPAENQQQAQWLAKWHRMHMVSSKASMPAGLPGDPPGRSRDGGYFAVLERD